MEEILTLAVDLGKEAAKKGFPATYIPELAKSDPSDVGVCMVNLDGEIFGYGDFLKPFTLQSITKVITLLLALEDLGEEEVFTHVHMEPTGDPFNSIMSFEMKNPEKPFNPMINAGAMIVTTLIKGNSAQEKLQRILDFTTKLTGNPQTTLHMEVYLSEKETGNRNRSLAYFMKSTGMMKGDVEETLDLYFLQCSILGTAKDVATIGAVLAGNGIQPFTKERVLSKAHARIAKTIMTTCGMYDASGEFAVTCGIPAKSGVGGGVLASVPNKFGIGTYGPSLDLKGNSLAGTTILEFLSRTLDLSIF
ncbi:MAG: glutaminase A [Clostridium sp.]|nr:glutaminase A [Clostridium sp.]